MEKRERERYHSYPFLYGMQLRIEEKSPLNDYDWRSLKEEVEIRGLDERLDYGLPMKGRNRLNGIGNSRVNGEGTIREGSSQSTNAPFTTGYSTVL